MNKFKIPLVMTTCLTAFLSHQAIAHSHKSSAKHHQTKSVGQTSSSSGKILPQDVRKIDSSKKTASVESSTSESEAIVVLGAGSSRETQSVSRTALMEYTPGTSPFKALSKLPGVMFTSSDPLGSYEWSQQIIIRGFDQSRLGFTMDGMPLGNLAYGNDNGLSIGRALQTENNGRATLSQGAGSVDVAASNDLGGALQFTSIDPTDKFGVDVAGTVGSASTWRTFMRVNTGKLPGGGKLYVSYDYQDANKWKGDGQQRQQQANAKFIQPLSENVKLTLFGDWSKRQENDYQDLSLATIGKYGYRVDNITGNYALAKEIASAYQNGTPYPAGIGSTNYGSPADFVYYNAAGLRQDALGYGRLDVQINDRLKGYAMVYGHTNSGEGAWVTPYQATPAGLGGSPLSVRTTEYDIHREGFMGGLTYHIGNHTIEGGFWFENNDFEQARRFYPLGENGTPNSLYWYKNNWFATQWQGAFNTKTYQVHLQDTWQITSQLKLNYGFKSLIVDNRARQIGANILGVKGPDGYPSGSIQAANGFLPQLGANYRINAHNEIFADFARNMAAFDNSQTGATSPFATTIAGYNAIKGSLKPEMSYTEELGYRYHDHKIQASLTGYYVEFENRLLTITQGTGIQGNASALANVGGVTARGIDAAFNYNFAPHWSLYASYAFNDSRYNDNVVSGATVYNIKGKRVVAMPRNLANVQIGYDDGSIWGNVNMQFQDKRTYTYTNDAWVPSNEIFNLNLGYRFHSQNIVLSGLDAQINVSNLFNKHYVATVGSNGFQFSDPDHTFATLQAGSPRMVFFTLRKHF
ncbi:MAG: TonB-dependent receptor [Acetobacter sp.]|jgi:iron complex outermembrane receptor protein|nr:TonB-dependent receptor [Acetobacter sp.]MCH4062690.1 TonB-dependent receptor [Acetobacter sp.]MCH4088464.1 TonB-dependent receptor [Acetobacter sp.]MCI1294620.1 TonB-dependent receptor [Acetobacter sp.]MCI1321330.1 TonB-dependent receptor [Acetobacter sp.]